MLASEPAVKRSSSSQAARPSAEAPETKRLKRPYHHHHQLQNPVNPALAEPAIADHAAVDHLLNRSIGMSLREAGFELADPVALDGFRNAAEECMFGLHLLRIENIDLMIVITNFTSYVRQSMLASRRIQPIPQDFELALKRHRFSPDDLLPHLKSPSTVEPTPTFLPSPPLEEDAFRAVSFLGPHLSGEDDRARSAHIPQHFPQFPSKHTYRYTPVFTQRELDPRRIRERATEDGRYGEEALRKLARAAFQDNQLGSAGREKKLWGRRTETMDSMFEKTIKGLAKNSQKNTTVPGTAAPMEIDSGAGPDVEVKPSRSKISLNVELPPIVNCERDFWRRTTASSNGPPRAEESQLKPEEKPNGTTEAANLSRVDSWVST